MSAPVRYDSRSGVAYIVLASPATANALTEGMLELLARFVAQASADGCRAIVLSAEGPDFCRGMDLDAASAAGGPAPALFRHAASCLSLVCRAPLPVIACVDGRATGGGVGLVAACDLVLASERASFMLSEAIIGMIPALITPMLARRVTPARLRYLALSTRGISAEEAHVFGLVDELVGDGMGAALDRQLQRILRSSPGALADCKAHAALGGSPLEVELEAAVERITRWLERPDVLEGLQAFAASRSPAWFQKHRRSAP